MHTHLTVLPRCKWMQDWPMASTTRNPRDRLPETWPMPLQDTLAIPRCNRNLCPREGRVSTHHRRLSIAQPATRALPDAAILLDMVQISFWQSENVRLLTLHSRAHPYWCPTPRLRLARMWETIHSTLGIDGTLPCAYWRKATHV
jgi:hypothetical protein